MAADSPVELIEFIRPCRNQNNLYVTNISRNLSEDEVQMKLTQIFSKFGLLYEVQVFDAKENTSEEPQSFCYHDNDTRSSLYAFVKFYSTKAAARAQRETNGKWLIGGQFLKVQFANRKKVVDTPAPLYMARCTELANYYLGFNGWSTKIIKIEKLDEKTMDNQEISAFMYRSIVRLEIKAHDCYCDGIGYGGDRKTLKQEKDPLKKLELTAIAKKIAHRHAFENAFKRVIIIALDNGKVSVEINQTDVSDCELIGLSEDGVVHINQVKEQTTNSDEEIEDEEILEALNALMDPIED
uniref:RAD52 motif-containing protein 1 n=1 Tax=Actinia equina TaxID=6106 RepID=A0A6C0WVD0_ACTEQ|nr:RAD52 motif-containing protein 1 [Actinia equina]